MDDTKSVSAEPEGSDVKGAIEEDEVRIRAIKGDEVLGYTGEGREEHSGQNEPEPAKRLEDGLADNLPEDMGQD